MKDESPLIAVTGATGYIGSVLCRRLVERGYRVRALSRSRPDPCLQHVPYDMGEDLVPGALQGVSGAIHLATDTAHGSNVDVQLEILAARRLLEMAEQEGCRFVYASSQVARPDAPTNYGIAKWRVEQEVLGHGGIVVRPGLVYGGPEKGLFGTLCRYVQRVPFIPALLPTPRVQPIHVEDVVEALITSVRQQNLKSEVLAIGEPQPIPFHAFLTAIAAYRVDRVAVLVPVPVTAAFLILELARKIIGPVADAGRLRSLVQLLPFETAGSLEKLGIRPLPLNEGLTRSGRNTRFRLIEAQTLYHYILGARPSPSLLRRYVLALKVDNAQPLRFRRWMRLVPSALVIFDQPSVRAAAGSAVFFRRLELAAILGETSTGHASRFIAGGTTYSSITRVVHLIGRLCLEGVVGIIAIPLRRSVVAALPTCWGSHGE